KQRRPRDVAVFSILRYTSMRRESVATLRMCHLDGEWGLRRVPVKGGKTQDIPLPLVVMQFLHVYVERVLVTQMEKVGPDAPLFWSTWGRRAGGKTRAPMTGKNIWRLCKVYGRIIGFPELKPHTTFERAALDFLDEQTRRPDLRLDMDLQPGDIHLINNYTIHSRTGFIDGPEPDQRRHMLRLWLKFPTVWPLSAEFPAHMGSKPSEDTPVLVEGETYREASRPQFRRSELVPPAPPRQLGAHVQHPPTTALDRKARPQPYRVAALGGAPRRRQGNGRALDLQRELHQPRLPIALLPLDPHAVPPS